MPEFNIFFLEKDPKVHIVVWAENEDPSYPIIVPYMAHADALRMHDLLLRDPDVVVGSVRMQTLYALPPGSGPSVDINS